MELLNAFIRVYVCLEMINTFPFYTTPGVFTQEPSGNTVLS